MKPRYRFVKRLPGLWAPALYVWELDNFDELKAQWSNHTWGVPFPYWRSEVRNVEQFWQVPA